MNAPQSSEKVKSCSKRHFYPSPPSRVPQQNIGRCPKDGGVKYTNKNPFLSFHLHHPEETPVPESSPLYRNTAQERSAKPLGNECRNFSLLLYQSLFENSFDFVGIDTALVLLFVCDVKRRNVIVIVGIF